MGRGVTEHGYENILNFALRNVHMAFIMPSSANYHTQVLGDHLN